MIDKRFGFGYNTLRRSNPADIGELCNGSTYDSDSYCLGSNPSSPAFFFLAPLSRGLGRGPLKAETRVRIPSELLTETLANQRLQGFFVVKLGPVPEPYRNGFFIR